MTVYVLFSTGYIEDYYSTENFVDIFSSEEKAQAYIDAVIHKRKLNCKQRQLEQAFGDTWEKEHPAPYENIQDTKPKYRHDRAHDKEYNQQHTSLVHEWRATVERPYQDRMGQYMEARFAAVNEYLTNVDLEQQDLSEIDLAYYGEQDNFLIKPVEIK